MPLAAAGIPIFYLSTYETDFTLVRFCSFFRFYTRKVQFCALDLVIWSSSNVFLVQITEENLSQALEVVQQHFTGADIDTSLLGDLPTQKKCTAPESAAQRHPITLPPGDLYLASIQKSTLGDIEARSRRTLSGLQLALGPVASPSLRPDTFKTQH